MVARRLAGRMPVLVNGRWVYPDMDEVLAEAGMCTIDECTRRRRNTLVAYVATRPIAELCTGVDRLPGSATNKSFWWDQLEWQLVQDQAHRAVGNLSQQ